MSGHTYTQDNYSNPRCSHARRGLINIVKLAHNNIYMMFIMFDHVFLLPCATNCTLYITFQIVFKY